MKIRLLIASENREYNEQVVSVLSERYSDTFDLSVCTGREGLEKVIKTKKIDVAISTPSLYEWVCNTAIRLPILLWDGQDGTNIDGAPVIQQYQRISSIASQVMELYSTVAPQGKSMGSENSQITVVWSPIGGCGKTTVALAYAAQMVSEGKKTLYLDLESFSSVPVYFPSGGKSISTALGSNNGNLELLIQGIRQQDSGSGIYYLGIPDNYDDISVLEVEDAKALIEGCVKNVDCLIVDLSSEFNDKIRSLLELADRVLVVTGPGIRSQKKLDQFVTQNDLYEVISDKTILVANKGARKPDGRWGGIVTLPVIKSDNPVVIYKSLSNHKISI